MVLPVWPASLPQPRLAGFQRKTLPRFVSFKADKLNAEKRRTVTTARPFEETLSFRLTTAEHETLEDFFHDDPPDGTGGGASRFTITDALSGVSMEAEFLEDGVPSLSESGQVPKHDVTIRLRFWP